MPILGTPYRVVYESKNLTAGLTGITAKVLRPDGTVDGTYQLDPLPGGAYFSGFYYFDLITTTSDPDGTWIAAIYSANEGVRDIKRVEMNNLNLRLAEVKKDVKQTKNLVTIGVFAK